MSLFTKTKGMKTFDEIYAGRPDKREVGSSGYSNMKNLYDICTELKPWAIFESGTWKGNSSWVFSHFAKKLSCYDIDFSNLMWRGDNIDYWEQDIETNNIRVGDGAGNDILFFFDDHISQLQRLKWLISIGAKYAVFDDNQPTAICKTLKNPPSPTLTQLMEEHHPIFDEIQKYEVMPFHGDRRNFDTRLTLIEL